MAIYHNQQFLKTTSLIRNSFKIIFFSLGLYYSGYGQSDSLTYDEWKKVNLLPELFFTSEIEEMSKNEKVKLPLEFYPEFQLEDLYDVDIKTPSFYSRLTLSIFTKYDTIYRTIDADTLDFDIRDLYFFIYPEDDKTYVREYYSQKINDTLHQWYTYFEGPLPHKWNLRNYPFDRQKLKFVFSTNQDTSLVTMTQPSFRPIDSISSNFSNLKDGYELGVISTIKEYYTVSTSNTKNYQGGERPTVFERLTYNVELNRNGSYLYFKLFFGAFLSFLISYLVFFINPSKFDTRITLSLGGIFGGVGNKYFVENTMPSVQVLTKADLINNLIIFLIILNIFIVIAQSTDKIKLRWIENNTNAAILSLLLVTILNLAVIYFP